MSRPTTSQMKNAIQVSTSRPIISTMQKMMLSTGKTGPERGTEGAVTFRFAVAKDEDRDGDQDEREEGADVGEVGDGADVEQAGGDADDESCDPGGDGGGADSACGCC